MSFLRQIVDAIKRLEHTIGLKTDYDVDTIYGKINRLEATNNNDLIMHSNNLDVVIIPSGYNVILSNPVSFTELVIEPDSVLTLLED